MSRTETTTDSQSVYSIQSQRNLVTVKTKNAIFRQRRWYVILTSVIIFLVALLLIVIVLALCSRRKPDEIKILCENEECMRIAASLKETMNESVDPCDDFYSYVCGRWHQEHPIPESEITNSWFDEDSGRLQKMILKKLRSHIRNTTRVPRSVLQAQILFRSCMDEEALNNLGLNPLYSLLRELNIPLVPSAFTNTTMDFIQQMARVKRILGREVFIGIDVVPDPKNNTKNIVMIGAPDWRSSFPGERRRLGRRVLKRKYQAEDNDETVNEAEQIFMYDTIKEVISNGTAEYRNCKSAISEPVEYEDKISEVVEQIYAVGEYLYGEDGTTTSNETDHSEDIRGDNYMFVDELQRITDEHVSENNATLKTPAVWRRFIDELFRDIIEPDWTAKNKILVWDLDYLKSIAVYFATQDDAVLETYVWWTVIETVAPYSSEDLRKIRSTYYQKIVEIEASESRSLRCTDTVNELMGMAVAWLFVDPTFHQDKSSRVIEMLSNIRTAFSYLVDESDWMDHLTKIATLRKNAEMKYVIGYPEWLFEEGTLDLYYENIDLSEGKFLENMLQLISDDMEAQFRSLLEDNQEDDAFWITVPSDVNAFHTFFANQITIPAGILQFPFYNLGLEALNYGAIGSILGHELTHGFDNIGRKYDSDGNYRQWWTNETISEYIERSQCFIDHYNDYYVQEVDEHVNGERTLGENIADNGGLKEAVFAYRLWRDAHGPELFLPGFTHLSHDQLLFLGFAHTWCEENTKASLRWMLTDSHCPAVIRLHGVLRNSKEFSEAWRCPVGSSMNPPKKCRLW